MKNASRIVTMVFGVLAALAGTLHRILDPVRIIDPLHVAQAAHADPVVPGIRKRA